MRARSTPHSLETLRPAAVPPEPRWRVREAREAAGRGARERRTAPARAGAKSATSTSRARRLLLVATDRLSAFDVVLPTPIPDKGRVLTALSLFWFGRTADLVANHLSSRPRVLPAAVRDDPRSPGRAMLVQARRRRSRSSASRAATWRGSGWTEYARDGTVCGVALPAGLVESDRLPEPIFTPTTKAEAGHDLPLTLEETGDLVGRRARRTAEGAHAHDLRAGRGDRAANAASSWPTRSSSSASARAS